MAQPMTDSGLPSSLPSSAIARPMTPSIPTPDTATPDSSTQAKAIHAAWFLHADRATLACAVAARMEDVVRTALAERGRAILALAGGSTPMPAYERFAAAELEWAAVTVIATDERWVADDSPASNLRQMRSAMRAAAGIRWCALKPRLLPAEASAHRASRMLARVPQAFDAVLLGMGNDAHTASLFPGAAQLQEALKPNGLADAMVIDPNPLPAEAPFARITLTLSRLLRARSILLVISGDEKRKVLEQAISAPSSSSASNTPVAQLLRAANAPIEIHWSP